MKLDPSCHHVRHPDATAVTTTDQIIFVKPGHDAHAFRDADVIALSQMWQALAQPIAGSQLAQIIPETAMTVVAALLQQGFVLSGAPEKLPEQRVGGEESLPAPACGRLVLGASGAMLAAFLPNYVQRLLGAFSAEVDVVLTDAARRFVQPYALTVLGASVWEDTFESRAGTTVPHVDLARSADLVLVLPASAHTVSHLAHGTCSDLMSLVVCATEAPVVVAPSMNPSMWKNPAVQRNVDLLRQDGVFVVEPGVGVEVADARVGPVLGPAGLTPSGNLIPTLQAVLQVVAARD